jgi:DNA-binding LacI/PurR family transcriptional regulator
MTADDLQLRPLQPEDAPELLRIHKTPEVVHWWDVPDPGFPLSVIDPAGANHAAIKAYTKVGFRPVGTLSEYERDTGGDGRHDGLLMELLASDRHSP